MNKKWTWSKMLLAAAAVALLVSGSTLFAAKGGGGKPPKDDPPPPEPVELPDVRYRIQFIQPPANANTTAYVYINDINNWGQVVGKYQASDGTRMFLYVNGDQALDLNEIVDMNALETVGLDPSQWRLRSALAINDWMVVVGNIEEISTGQVRPIAVDLFTGDPVVDLLPDVGVDQSHGFRINENGDILGVVQLAGGGWASWIYNPGLYGDPALRAPRDPAPLDMSDEIPELLPLSGDAAGFDLNNPVGNSPAQIAGVGADGVAFRYTLGDEKRDPLLERFPEVDLQFFVAGLNDSGTFCGLHRGPKIKGKIRIDPFRFNQSLELLPMPMDDWMPIQGLNSSGDLVTYVYVYRDDWGWVKIDDLVVADEEADIQAWNNGSVSVFGINDRGGPSEAAQITGRISDGRIFVLTPELLNPLP